MRRDFRQQIRRHGAEEERMHPEIVDALAQLLEDWRRCTAVTRLPADEEAVEAKISEELERLRSLVYIQ